VRVESGNDGFDAHDFHDLPLPVQIPGYRSVWTLLHSTTPIQINFEGIMTLDLFWAE